MNVNLLNSFEDATGGLLLMGKGRVRVGGVGEEGKGRGEGEWRGRDTNSNGSNHKRSDKITVNSLCRVKQMSEV
jgi:hypothetical protein